MKKKKLVNYIVDYFGLKSPYDNYEEKKKIIYIISILIKETEAIVLLCVLFSVLNMGKLFLTSLLVVICTRTFAGGIHENESTKCLLHTFLFFVLVIYISKCEFISNMGGIIYLIYIALLVGFAPIDNKARGYFSYEKRKRMKYLSVVGVTVSFLIGFLFAYLKCVINSTLLLETMEYIYSIIHTERGMRYGGKNKTNAS